jgi:hypothetical protein
VLEARLRATNAATFRFSPILRTVLRKRPAAFLLRQKPLQGFSPQKRLAEALPQLPPARNPNVDSPCGLLLAVNLGRVEEPIASDLFE